VEREDEDEDEREADERDEDDEGIVEDLFDLSGFFFDFRGPGRLFVELLSGSGIPVGLVVAATSGTFISDDFLHVKKYTIVGLFKHGMYISGILSM